MNVQEIVAKLNSIGADKQCVVCGNTNWESHDSLVFAAEGFPSVAVFCTECGHIRFHSARLLEQA